MEKDKALEVVDQLNDLISDRKAFIHGDDEYDGIFRKDIEALKWAVDFIRQNMENEKNDLFVLDDYWRAKLQDTFMELLAASVKRPDEEEEIMNLIERVCDCILFLRTGEGL